MRRAVWVILVALLVGAGTVIGFEVGGRAGFNEGFCTASKMHDVVSGVMVMEALKALGKGNIDDARSSLESTLDISIVGISANSRFSPKLQSFAPYGPPRDAPLLKRIAKYRESHPYEDPVAKPAVDSLLARYGTPPQAQH